MGGYEGDPDPALQSFVTGVYIPFILRLLTPCDLRLLWLLKQKNDTIPKIDLWRSRRSLIIVLLVFLRGTYSMLIANIIPK